MPREILDLSVSLFLVTHFIILYSLFGCVALFVAIKTAMKQRLWAWSDVMIYKRKQAKLWSYRPKKASKLFSLTVLSRWNKIIQTVPCVPNKSTSHSQYHLLQGWGFLEDVTLGVLLYDLWIEIYLADGTEILPPPFIWAKHQWEGCFSAYTPLVLIAKCLEEGKRRPIFTLWLRYKVDRTMAQLWCCTAPELLCSHLYKSDAIDIERIDTSIREKHAKQLGFFFCFCPPLAFFHSMPGSRQKEGISFHCLIYALYLRISPFDIFPWQKHTQHGIKMMISIIRSSTTSCVCVLNGINYSKWEKQKE